MRIAMGVEYDGSAYHGWQSQVSAPSVQQQVEEAISKVADHRVQVVCAGRTDTGVHATQQVIHFDTEAVREIRSWILGVNTHLPRDIVILWAKLVDEEFHARFKAISRSYRYVILNRFTRSAIHNSRVTWFHKSLDIARM
jgi:tRNA pseudouridine38-40 synthase